MNYNTQQERLRLPEYGRIIQMMVDHALTLTTKEERQTCAETIVAVMAGFFPQQKTAVDFEKKLWNHLAFLADYQLDIDYPVEITPKDSQTPKSNLAYPSSKIRYKHYGTLTEQLIQKVDEMPEGEEKDALMELLVNQMRKSLAEWNPNVLSDEKVADDLARFSEGRIQLNPTEFVPFKVLKKSLNANTSQYGKQKKNR